ncbi:cytochrome P450 [Zunongwangia sp. SCSIO 43204]|uniref:cytochrome P450 n=1 Tax=Zunongwangia sp. SCSIO 43204 TaxID=2779359 RepID=UPI001CA9F4C5|nr:cytochrome P450 [Zunongwangia sp. SCSIO 43204]UAB84798.1 cytochrome P450 [Zunongwangia sp. SCSIO 43204]
MKKEIPQVSTFTFLKNAAQIVKNPLPFHRENFAKHGDIFRLNIGPKKSVIFCRDAEFAKYVLQKNQKNYIKSEIQIKDLVKYVGNGLLTSNGEHWQKQRKLIQPAFHKKHIANLLDTVLEAIRVEYLKIRLDKTVDVYPVFNDLAFQTVVKSLFSSAASQEEINRLQFVTEANQKMLVKELRQPYKHLWFNISGKLKHHLKLSEESRQILKNIVHKRKKNPKRYDDLLDMLLDARYEDGQPMSEEQLIDEILILFVAGHETTSNSLSFTTQLLAQNPQIQDKIFAEVKAASDKTNSLMDFLQQCPYTQNVILESMRLYPPAYFMDRVNLEEDEFNGLKFDKKSNLLFSFYEIHRSEKHWENPLEFNPDRFTSNKNPEAYFPFGAGPRKCIGSNFAMYEMILAVSELVLNYKILPVKEEIEILPLITLKPKNAFVEFQKRA